MTIQDPSSQPKFGRWKHKNTDHVYEILNFGLIEKTLEPSVIYQGSGGQIWIRPATEFFDGRFEQISGEVISDIPKGVEE